VSRREQKMPPLPADLNERLMQRIEETEQTRPEAKSRRLWLYTASALAVAASIALLIVFNFGKQQPPQEPLVAQTVYHGDGSSDTPSAIVEEPASVDAPATTDTPVYQKNRPHDTQRKVVMQLVELIPTSESTQTDVKTLPASVIDKVKAYDQASDLSRTTGIDDGSDAIVARTMDMDEDPLVAMAAQVEGIRQRGQRLQQEITALMNN
ncbi:MAG: hypothetical protein J5502_09805, partial [Prevotella sp.]|nr:hypothetical protein [Prevotella sp.]